MTQSTQSFTQSLRLLDPVNQKRIAIRERILWPDYETLNLLNTFYENSQNTETQMDLTNLFMYCPYEENFTIIKTNKQEYFGLNQLYSHQYTHLAFWICKQDQYSQRNKLATRFTENTQSVDNRRLKSLQKVYRTKQKVSKSQQIYVILCKRPIAIDQIIKTPHKVCIGVVPLSGQKFLWGGALNYEEFQSLQHEKREQSSLFKTGGESFGFKIDPKPSFLPSSYRKSNGLIDKRQQRYSNYFKAQKEQPKQIQTQRARRQCSNKIKILPQHIRQHQQLLYIQIDLTNHPQLPQRADEFQFVSIDIYGRHLKPTYGGVYENQSQSQDQDDYFDELKGALNKYKKLLEQEIFLVYSMPFMQFNSYLQSQINYEQNQQLREINFRGSCLMFSAMKKLQLKSTQKKQHNQNNKQKQFEQNPFQKNKKHKFIETKEGNRVFNKDYDLIQIDTNNNHVQQKQKHIQGLNKANIKNKDKDKEIIRILPSSLNLEKQQLQLSKRQQIRDYKLQIINKLCNGLTQTQRISNSQQHSLVYIPVFNPQGFEPLRIGVDRKWMAYINPQISRSITRVFVQNERIRGYEQNEIQQQLATQNMNRKRLSVYVGKSKKDKPIQKQKDLVGIDVFLTDKVYKQQTVYGLIYLFKQLQQLRRSNKLSVENHCYEQMFTNIISIEQFRNFVILIDDIKGQKSLQQVENNINNYGQQISNINNYGQQISNIKDYGQQVKQLLWKQMIQRMNNYTQGQLQRIRQVQTQTNSLIQQAQKVSINYQNNIQLNKQTDGYLEQKQHQIINKIKQYHYYYSTDSQQTKLYINLFVSFFSSSQNNESNQRMVQHLLLGKQSCQSFVQQVFNEFFLINCKLMIQCYSLYLSSLIQKLQQQYIILDHQNNQSSSNLNNNKNIHLLLLQVLKISITYVIDNLSSIPINIFLSQPLQQIQSFDNQQDYLDSLDHNNHHNSTVYSYDKLRRFLKKYFIRGHNFLDRQANQSLIDSDNVHINIMTDLLNLYIKVTNIQTNIKQIIQNNDHGFRLNQHREIKNVIQLIQQQYSHILISNNNLQFDKLSFVLNNNNSIYNDSIYKQLIRSQVHGKFKRNYVQYKQMERLIQRKQRQISQYQNEWMENNLNYLINWNKELIKQQIQSQPTIIINNEYNQPLTFSQSNQYHSSIFNFNLNLQQSNNHLLSFITFYPTLFNNNNNNNNHNNSSSQSLQNNDSYSINVVKTHLGLNYQSNSYNNNNNINNNHNSLFDCYQVFVSVQITTNKSITTNKTENNQQQSINDLNKYTLKGSNLFIFQNYNHNRINKNNIYLHPYFNCQDLQKHTIKQCSQLSNIHQVNIKIYSKKLPILSASLSFINLRLPKYLKNLSKKSTSINSRKSSIHATNRKTIGGRYTQHLNNRKSVLSIEQNIFFSQTSTKSKNNPQFSTLFNLPQTLLFDLLRVDKSYIQDQEKILHFIDEFYQRNQPQYEDYILYLCLRPNFIRLSTILKHYFANKLKYDDSKILNSIIKNKLSSFKENKQNQNISQLIIKKPRISSYEPLKNILDTNEQRQLLNKYMKDLTRKKSLSKNQHSQSIGKNSLFAKKSIFQVNQQRKENPKEFQI